MRKTFYLAFMAIAVSLGFVYFVIPQCLANRAACFGNGELVAPFVYRILPSILKPLYGTSPEGGLWVDTLAQISMTFVIIPLLYRWLRQSLTEDKTIHGISLFVVVWILALHYWFRSVNTTLEILFIVITLNLLNRTWLWLIPITTLASLNRETALLIPAIYIAYHGRKMWCESSVLLTVWVGITSLLHIVIGSFPHELGLLGTLQYNLGNLPDALIANLLLIPLAIMVVMGYNRATRPFKRFMWIALVYIAAVAVGGSWMESERLLLPVLPLVLTMMLKQ